MICEQEHFFQAKEGDGKLPCFKADGGNANIANFYLDNREYLKRKILTHGGVLLRNFDITSLSEFNKLLGILSPQLLDYNYRSTPRTKIAEKIYTTTEYPRDRRIPFHNECSFSLAWPSKLYFFCVIPAEVGGETALADSRAVLRKISPSIVKEFENNGVMYVRRYRKGLDLPWQEVFQTETKSEVERYCKDNLIDCEWGDGEVELTTRQTCQATLQSPQTDEKVWFNQAHLFHHSAMNSIESSALEELIQDGGYPRDTLFGNGEEIPIEMLEEIHAAYESERLEFRWKKRDVLIIDNILMAHSRNSYEGNRKIVVSMGD